jgi:hypothetical protein
MGSARLGYAADAVLLMRPMEPAEMTDHYRQVVDEEQFKADLAADGVSPMIITLAKGRDGMVRGSWPAEFHFNESRISEGVVTRTASGPRPSFGGELRGPRPPANITGAGVDVDMDLDDE